LAGPARELAAVFAGGAAGALLRVLAAESLPAGNFPWPTLAVNLAGAFLLGAVMARVASGAGRALLGAGLCGGLTTFSTLQLELLDLLGAGRIAVAATYAAASLALGLAAVGAGRRLA